MTGRHGHRHRLLQVLVLLLVAQPSLTLQQASCKTSTGGSCVFEVDTNGFASSRVEGGGSCQCTGALGLNKKG